MRCASRSGFAAGAIVNDPVTTILVIEDEEVLRVSLSDYLEDRGFRVLSEENGRAGLEVFERVRPDLVLTDLRMPEADGLDVLEGAKKLCPDVPLIVVSGTGRIDDSIQALRMGAWDFILKPVEDMSIIMDAVNQALERALVQRENRTYQANLEKLVEERTAELEQANTRLKDINARLRKVIDTTRKLSAYSEVTELGSTLLTEFASHMRATSGSLFLVDNGGLRLLHSLKPEGPEPGEVASYIPFPLPEGSLLRRAVEEGQPILIEDISKDETIRAGGAIGYRGGSALAFPLADEARQPAGVLTLHSETPSFFVAQDKEIGAILASYSSETLRATHAAETLRRVQSDIAS